MSQLRVFTFFPAFGLPTGGPFALKLLKWLDIGGIDYQQVIENDSGKGPNKKNPWVELNRERIPDSELIIDRLTDIYGFDIDAGLEPTELARLHAFRRMIEEHLHMVFEWEMFVPLCRRGRQIDGPATLRWGGGQYGLPATGQTTSCPGHRSPQRRCHRAQGNRRRWRHRSGIRRQGLSCRRPPFAYRCLGLWDDAANGPMANVHTGC
jgi:hypothetical protein